MGGNFLFHMYESYCAHNDSGVIIACEEGRVIGFLAYSNDFSALYRYMIKKKLLCLALCSLRAIIRKPKAFLHLIKAFLKPGEARRSERYVELASIGVKPECKTNGVGTLLINELKRQVNFDEYEYINLETDALNNDSVNRFYQKNGFVLSKTYVTDEGRKMNEYRFSPKK